ncbi:MAG: hypothetical protein P1V18_02725 [Candidatus Gracilibacteria bacterium]|nr:hypothetical protein [Candidatus Gracilibacteria bacterium]
MSVSPEKFTVVERKNNDHALAEFLPNEDSYEIVLTTQEFMSVVDTVRGKGLDLLQIKGTLLTVKSDGINNRLYVYHPETGTRSNLETCIEGNGLSSHTIIFREGEILHVRSQDTGAHSDPIIIYPVGPDQRTLVKSGR